MTTGVLKPSGAATVSGTLAYVGGAGDYTNLADETDTTYANLSGTGAIASWPILDLMPSDIDEVTDISIALRLRRAVKGDWKNVTAVQIFKADGTAALSSSASVSSQTGAAATYTVTPSVVLSSQEDWDDAIVKITTDAGTEPVRIYDIVVTITYTPTSSSERSGEVDSVLGSVTSTVLAEKTRAAYCLIASPHILLTCSAEKGRAAYSGIVVSAVTITAGGWKGTSKNGTHSSTLGAITSTSSAVKSADGRCSVTLERIVSRNTGAVAASLQSITVDARCIDPIEGTVAAVLGSVTTDGIGFVQSCDLAVQIEDVQCVSFAYSLSASDERFAFAYPGMLPITVASNAKVQSDKIAYVSGQLGSVTLVTVSELDPEPALSEERVGYVR